VAVLVKREAVAPGSVDPEEWYNRALQLEAKDVRARRPRTGTPSRSRRRGPTLT
jgi:hypothetical protein